MDFTAILAQLRQELENLDAAILSLERLQANSVRRGRPPKVLAEIRQSRSTAQNRDRQTDSASERS